MSQRARGERSGREVAEHRPHAIVGVARRDRGCGGWGRLRRWCGRIDGVGVAHSRGSVGVTIPLLRRRPFTSTGRKSPGRKSCFGARFQRHEMPSDLAEITLVAAREGLTISQLLKQAGLVPSTSNALSMIEQGAVKIDGERVEDKKLVVPCGESRVYQVGKRRFARVVVQTTE